MVDFVEKNDRSGYLSDIDSLINFSLNNDVTNFGVSSGHMCFALPSISDSLGSKFKTFVTVRPPENFVVSALCRGFFDPSHPYYLEQIRPNKEDKMASNWEVASPFEKCLWYWNIVNRSLLKFIEEISPNEYRLINIEQLNLDAAAELCRYVGFKSIDFASIAELLDKKVNATPKLGLESHSLNPYSRPSQLPEPIEWSDEQKELVQNYTYTIRKRYSSLGLVI